MDIEFPQPPSLANPTTSPFTDDNGQVWVWNGKNWVRQATDPGIADCPDDGQQYSRSRDPGELIGEWDLSYADAWYLGPSASAPLVDQFGASIIIGHVYYNNVDLIMYAWNGSKWEPFSPILRINSLGDFAWDSLPGNIVVDAKIPWPDDYGNDRSNWVNGETIISVYVDGQKLVEEKNAALITGDYVVDYANDDIIIKNNPILSTATIVVSVGVISKETYISASDNNASGFAFVIDEDDFISDLDSKLPTQQSTKAFINAELDKLVDKLISGEIQVPIENISAIGSVFDFAGPIPPIGALVCDASEKPISVYPTLYAAIGDTWANTNGAATPAAENFRLPPSEIDGVGLTRRGATSVNGVGTFLATQNKRHQHSTSLTLSGAKISSAGAHSHSMTYNVGGFANGSSGRCLVGQGGANPVSKSSSTNGGHSHNISFSDSSIDMGNEGGDEARPASIALLTCIWAD